MIVYWFFNFLHLTAASFNMDIFKRRFHACTSYNVRIQPCHKHLHWFLYINMSIILSAYLVIQVTQSSVMNCHYKWTPTFWPLSLVHIPCITLPNCPRQNSLLVIFASVWHNAQNKITLYLLTIIIGPYSLHNSSKLSSSKLPISDLCFCLTQCTKQNNPIPFDHYHWSIFPA